MSRDLKERKIVIYPQYLDCSASRSQGRRVPKTLCSSNPTLEDIVKAAQGLGLEAEVELEKKYPRMWRRSGRVIVSKKGSKSRLLKIIASEVKKLKSKVPGSPSRGE